MVFPLVKKLSVDDSQLFTVPVKPGSVNVVEFEPAQTSTLPPETPEVGAPFTYMFLVKILVDVKLSPAIPPYS